MIEQTHVVLGHLDQSSNSSVSADDDFGFSRLSRSWELVDSDGVETGAAAGAAGLSRLSRSCDGDGVCLGAPSSVFSNERLASSFAGAGGDVGLSSPRSSCEPLVCGCGFSRPSNSCDPFAGEGLFGLSSPSSCWAPFSGSGFLSSPSSSFDPSPDSFFSGSGFLRISSSSAPFVAGAGDGLLRMLSRLAEPSFGVSFGSFGSFGSSFGRCRMVTFFGAGSSVLYFWNRLCRNPDFSFGSSFVSFGSSFFSGRFKILNNSLLSLAPDRLLASARCGLSSSDGGGAKISLFWSVRCVETGGGGNGSPGSTGGGIMNGIGNGIGNGIMNGLTGNGNGRGPPGPAGPTGPGRTRPGGSALTSVMVSGCLVVATCCNMLSSSLPGSDFCNGWPTPRIFLSCAVACFLSSSSVCRFFFLLIKLWSCCIMELTKNSVFLPCFDNDLTLRHSMALISLRTLGSNCVDSGTPAKT
ncbi:hypothetical protein OGAPHI_003097 [Ogataea philodendri]|uniref:Uncharacterized protein n=1 Tax=Ogataea philodendri TaxID=1378263 RepID=A0A9P8P803_9ASCO|nr:uncharacterized protein OGAPHI_003097 [Ogataea philodendri]KAH3667448.1 hypothetical protein OGAPHI_003097 [Ogataea philodendri]